MNFQSPLSFLVALRAVKHYGKFCYVHWSIIFFQFNKGIRRLTHSNALCYRSVDCFSVICFLQEGAWTKSVSFYLPRNALQDFNSCICPYSFCVVPDGQYLTRRASSTQTFTLSLLCFTPTKGKMFSFKSKKVAKINIRHLMKSHMQVKSICTPPVPVSDIWVMSWISCPQNPLYEQTCTSLVTWHVHFGHIMNEGPQQSELPVFEGFLGESVRITLVDASYWAVSAPTLSDHCFIAGPQTWLLTSSPFFNSSIQITLSS